jgi:prevent-host-death family protein
MHVSSTEAKNKFGQMLDECQHHPVIIKKAGRRRGVLMSAAQYDQLVAKAPQVPGTQTPGEKFYSEYKDWVDMQNDLVEKFGVFGEEYRV